MPREEKTETAYHKGQAVKLTMTDWVGALTRNDPDWSGRPPAAARSRPQIDLDRVAWEKKRRDGER
jgi:hypothetical protein